MAGFIMGYVSLALVPILAMLTAIAVPNFVQARSTAQRNVCIANLKQIDGAKEQWALENKKTLDTPAVVSEVNAYLRSGQTPLCPAGGVYTYNAVGTAPQCSLEDTAGHRIPE